ncbi:MAG: DUF3820 family protein [Pseudomonadales bacterium]
MSVDAHSQEELVEAVNQVMPFGRYAGRRLIDIPEAYFIWFHNEGFPRGKLGAQMALMYEIKINSLDALVRPLLREADEQ